MKSILLISAFLLSSPAAFAVCSQGAKVKTLINELHKDGLSNCQPSLTVPSQLNCDENIILEVDLNQKGGSVYGYTGECSYGTVWYSMKVQGFGKELSNGLCEVQGTSSTNSCQE